MISDSEVQETFYNAMVYTMLTGIISGYNPVFVKTTLLNTTSSPQFIKDIVVETFTNILQTSKITQALDQSLSIEIISVKGNTITVNNVSINYKQLFQRLTTAFQTKSTEMLQEIAGVTTNLPNFKVIIDKVIKFYLESSEQKTDTIKKVTLDAIRDTFYNIMVEQYYLNSSVTKDDIESCEAHIFIALSCYAVFSIATSHKSLNGVKLCNNAIVTEENCPNLYKPLFKILLELKQMLNGLNLTKQEEKHILDTVSMIQDPNAVPQIVRNEVKTAISKISEISIQISQIQHFKNVIGNVLDFILEMY